jgi:CheY-like chemotaxis protein
MDGRDGIDLLTELQRLSPMTRPILMSAYATARDHQTATDLGAVTVLCKPFEPDALFKAIRQAEECESGFRGSVHGLSLVDMLQMFHFGRRSLTLSVSGAQSGKIHLDSGEIVHAERGSTQGVEALRSLLAEPSGSLKTGILESVESTIQGSFDSLLLDALRMIDEGHDADGGDRYSDASALSELRDSLAPPALDEIDPVESRVQPVVRQIMPQATVWAVDPESGVSRIICEGVFTEDVGAIALGMAAALSRLDPSWTCVEHVLSDAAIGLLRMEDQMILIATPLMARHGKERFRSQLWSVVDRMRRAS